MATKLITFKTSSELTPEGVEAYIQIYEQENKNVICMALMVEENYYDDDGKEVWEYTFTAQVK